MPYQKRYHGFFSADVEVAIGVHTNPGGHPGAHIVGSTDSFTEHVFVPPSPTTVSVRVVVVATDTTLLPSRSTAPKGGMFALFAPELFQVMVVVAPRASVRALALREQVMGALRAADVSMPIAPPTVSV